MATVQTQVSKKVCRSVKGCTKSLRSFVFPFHWYLMIKFRSSGLVKLSQQRWVVFIDFLDSFLWQNFPVKQFSLKQHNLKMKLPGDLKPKPVDPLWKKILDILIHLGCIPSSVVAPGCKWEKRNELSVSISSGPWRNIPGEVLQLRLKLFLVSVVFYEQKVKIKCSDECPNYCFLMFRGITYLQRDFFNLLYTLKVEPQHPLTNVDK